MFCKSCGESLKAGVKFCGKCGATVEVTASEGIQCPKCGAVNKPGAKFCRQDGTPLVDALVTAQAPGRCLPSSNLSRAQAAPTVRPVTRPSHRLQEPAPPLRPVPQNQRRSPAGGGTSRLWLAIGGLAVLAAAGGGYWLYKSRGASPQVVETTQAPDSQTPETYAPREQEGDVVEPPAPAKSETPSSAQSQVADAPQVSVGDRWVTEVVDHQDRSTELPRRAHGHGRRTTIGSFTSVRTVGKDYTRVVEYTGEWALVATHLRSGATTSYSPALPYLSFPLQPGRSWQARVVETDAEGKQRVHDVRAQMESWETVQVPAGTFDALKIVLTDDISKDGVVVQQGQDVSWYAPEARRTVKTEETSFDPATGERRRRTISLVEYSLQGSGMVGTGGNNALQSLPAEVIVAGGCPFEGCQLGRWTAREEVPVYDRKNGSMVSRLQAGLVINATDAEIHATPVKGVVTKVYSSDEAQGIRVGTVVHLLFPLGEGAVAVWHDGKVKNGSLDLEVRTDDPNQGKGNVLHWTWWVHIRLPDGSMGWLRNPQGHFDGMDAHGDLNGRPRVRATPGSEQMAPKSPIVSRQCDPVAPDHDNKCRRAVSGEREGTKNRTCKKDRPQAFGWGSGMIPRLAQ